MMSKKFIAMEKIQGNNSHTLKLVSEVERAVPFSFKKITKNTVKKRVKYEFK